MLINIDDIVHEIIYDYLLNYSIKEELIKYIKEAFKNINNIQKHVPILYIGTYENVHILGYTEIEVLNKSKDFNYKFNIQPIFI